MITIPTSIAPKIRAWLDTGRGVAVWSNKDLCSSQLGQQVFTPGDKLCPPDWRLGDKPDRIITDRAEFQVEEAQEVARVKIRRGPICFGNVQKQDRIRLDNKLGQFAKSYWVPDYSTSKYGSPWFDAVIMQPTSAKPL